MLTPEELTELPRYIEDLFADYDDFVMRDFSRRVASAGKVTDTAAWQARRASEWGACKKALGEEAKRVLRLAKEGASNILTDAYTMSNNADFIRYKSAGLFAERVISNDALMRHLEAAIKQTNGLLKNISGTTGFVYGNGGVCLSLTDAYIRSLDLAQLQVSSGVLDYNTAVRNAVKTAADSGVQYIDYESGYHLNIAAAARMCTLTGVNQMAARMNDQICDELGLDLVEVTAHAGARPSHQVWQGGIYSRSGKSDKYDDLYAATGLGTVTGLCGANCRHNYYGYLQGSPRAWPPEKLAKIDPEPVMIDGKRYAYYELTQKQRQLERQIRKTKRELLGYNEVPELRSDFVAASIKLNRQRRRYENFSAKAGLSLQSERTQEYKYGPSISMKAVWANRKGV